ncbi:hypothetical protein PsorP6_017533 [Peronosclerospora sorghi]|uniref:Uncharacterized protein n=1 Tax=Peronosclerospora sorghi TaxID=230839 RepID=A0ACC0WL43_9STRA|nr:hypothetical protein PsorP6_017533 [Peronosclerospora sorghi]
MKIHAREEHTRNHKLKAHLVSIQMETLNFGCEFFVLTLVAPVPIQHASPKKQWLEERNINKSEVINIIAVNTVTMRHR